MKRTFMVPVLGTALMLAASGVASATTNYTFDFTQANQDSSFATLSNFACTNVTNCSVKVSATAWWFNGSFSGSNFAASTNAASASLGIYNAGLGVCNPSDPGYSGGSCSSPEHQVDNRNGVDMILLTFSTAVDLTSLGLTNFGGINGGTQDADLTYWVNKSIASGTSLSSLGTGTTIANTVSGSNCASNGCSLSDTVNLSNVTTLLISAAVLNTDGNYDGFKVTSVGASAITGTPEPASMVMLGSGLLACGLLRRRKKNDSK